MTTQPRFNEDLCQQVRDKKTIIIYSDSFENYPKLCELLKHIFPMCKYQISGYWKYYRAITDNSECWFATNMSTDIIGLDRRPVSDFYLVEKEEGKEEMLPCPFCGGKPVIEQKGSNGYKIKCKSCLIGLTQKVLRNSMEWLRETMIKDWNKRVASHPLPTSSDKELKPFKYFYDYQFGDKVGQSVKPTVEQEILIGYAVEQFAKQFNPPVQPKEELRSAQEILDYNYNSFIGTRISCQDWEPLTNNSMSEIREMIILCMKDYAEQLGSSQQTKK